MTNCMVGKVVKGTVVGVEKYGIFVKISNNYYGMIHISEASYGYVEDLHNIVNVGETINVKVLDAGDSPLKMKLSIKGIEYRRPCKKYISIPETEHAFNTLKKMLPLWIKNGLNNK